jgi:hypothetical protein
VNGGGATAALAAHDRSGFAGKGCELHLAIRSIGDVSGKRGLAGAGIAEQAKNLRRAVGPGLCSEPVADRVERFFLLRRELCHRRYQYCVIDSINNAGRGWRKEHNKNRFWMVYKNVFL